MPAFADPRAATRLARDLAGSAQLVPVIHYGRVHADGADPTRYRPRLDTVSALRGLASSNSPDGSFVTVPVVSTGRRRGEIVDPWGETGLFDAEGLRQGRLVFGDDGQYAIEVAGRHGLELGPGLGGTGSIVLDDDETARRAALHGQLADRLRERFPGVPISEENATGGPREIAGRTLPDGQPRLVVAYTDNGAVVHRGLLRDVELARRIGEELPAVFAENTPTWGTLHTKPGADVDEFHVREAHKDEVTRAILARYPNARLLGVVGDRPNMEAAHGMRPTDRLLVVGDTITDDELATVAAAGGPRALRVPDVDSGVVMLGKVARERMTQAQARPARGPVGPASGYAGPGPAIPGTPGHPRSGRPGRPAQ